MERDYDLVSLHVGKDSIRWKEIMIEYLYMWERIQLEERNYDRVSLHVGKDSIRWKEIMIEYLYMWERIQLDGKRL